ncbi:metal/formaldehyde-sensitive transcriptional repressor [Ralstonia sp. 25C]|uniref:metal/formaldehyde-sensitive transcriptional repressor n=1 Tax=Ralstonia sp. 25C TaxID=3447363 RepID=UPI003F75316F
MPSSPEDKKRVLMRVRRITGQCQALERALEEGVSCAALLQQIASARGAINGLMTEVLETHIREEFGGASDTKSRELLSFVRNYMK